MKDKIRDKSREVSCENVQKRENIAISRCRLAAASGMGTGTKKGALMVTKVTRRAQGNEGKSEAQQKTQAARGWMSMTTTTTETRGNQVERPIAQLQRP